MDSYHFLVEDNFIRYAKIDTTAYPNSDTFPSSMKQKNLAKVLVQELLDIGLSDAHMDEYGYVFASIPSNTDRQVPTICFCAHMDTAPDVTGTNVKPIVHRNYDGSPITLPDDPSQVITTEQHPYLKERIGDDIITASGTTLLGADDKAGVAIIMDFAHYIQQHPTIKHGKIRILFTPDEEIGRGVDYLDIKKLDADYGYTLDGGTLGSIADSLTMTFHGVSAHPGYAKGKMVNALKLVADFVAALPKDRWSPETTQDREGFVHPTAINGTMEKASVSFIIRDHVTENLTQFEDELQAMAQMIIEPHRNARVECTIKEQYRNMKEVLQSVPFVAHYAIQAMERVGIQPKPTIIRGGTDGARLSFMDLPCPNLFTGEMGIHSKHEYVSVQDMQKAVKTLVELVKIWEQHTEN